MCFMIVSTFQHHWTRSQPQKCVFFRFSPPFQTKIIYFGWQRLKSLQFGQSAQFDDGLDTYLQVEITLCQNSLMPSFGEKEVLMGPRRKNLLFLKPLMENSKLPNISKNETPRSIRRGDMRGFPHFDLKKGPSKLSKELEILYVHLVGALKGAFWEPRLFSSIVLTYLPRISKKWFLGKFFSFFVFFFLVCSSHNSPLNWAGKMKFRVYIQ